MRITRTSHNTSGTLPLLPDTAGLPTSLREIPGFADAWDDWKAYRRKIKKSLTGKTARDQLMFLSEQSDPIAVVRQSMANSWQGLFPIKGEDGDTELPVIEGAALDYKTFSTLMEGLEATFGRPASKRRRTEYYRLLGQHPAPVLTSAFKMAKTECQFFPTPKVLLEFVGRLKRRPLESSEEDPVIRIECECGTGLGIRTDEIKGAGYFKCSGSMAKGFTCNRRYTVAQVKATMNS